MWISSSSHFSFLAGCFTPAPKSASCLKWLSHNYIEIFNFFREIITWFSVHNSSEMLWLCFISLFCRLPQQTRLPPYIIVIVAFVGSIVLLAFCLHLQASCAFYCLGNFFSFSRNSHNFLLMLFKKENTKTDKHWKFPQRFQGDRIKHSRWNLCVYASLNKTTWFYYFI